MYFAKIPAENYYNSSFRSVSLKRIWFFLGHITILTPGLEIIPSYHYQSVHWCWFFIPSIHYSFKINVISSTKRKKKTVKRKSMKGITNVAILAILCICIIYNDIYILFPAFRNTNGENLSCVDFMQNANIKLMIMEFKKKCSWKLKMFKTTCLGFIGCFPTCRYNTNEWECSIVEGWGYRAEAL